MPLQIVEGHYLFSTKWVGLDDGISTKWSAQRKQYKMTGHIHKQVILDEERNLMLYRSCSGGTCPCIKTKTHFVDMLRVTPIRFAFFSALGKGSLQNDSRFLNITQDTPRCSNKNLYKMSLWKKIYIYIWNQPLEHPKMVSTKWENTSPFFGQNPARHKMMVYAGHVPTHFVLEIWRGIINNIYIVNTYIYK